MHRSPFLIASLALALSAFPAIAQDASARTVQYHSQDIVPIHAKLKYTTLIELPTTEKIMEAATGDKDFWIVDIVGNFCFVHPAKAGISSNLNLITDKGNIYSFTLQDVSDTSEPPDLKVIVQPADRSAIIAASGPPQFVPATQLEQSKQQLAAVESHITQAVDEYKSAYAGRSPLDIYREPLLLGLMTLFLQLPFSIPRDIKRKKELKYGRRLRGPVMLTPRQFNRSVQGDGIGFKTSESRKMMRIPLRVEDQHIELMGDTGSGKTALIMQVLRQIQGREQAAIVYDPACEFIQRFYNAQRGDIVLNPLDERCPYWGPSEELRRKSEADAIAVSLFQPPQDKKGEFFYEIPQQIFAHLLHFRPTPEELIAWMSNPKEIDRRVQGTEVWNFIDRAAPPQRVGVLASLSKVAKSLRLLPKKGAGNGEWTAAGWSEKRDGWIFITSEAAQREALRPLQSLWIDLLVLRLLNAPQSDQRPVWFVLDELASLQRLPQLHTAITENRKSKNPLLLGFQGKAQLEVIYGHLAEVMLSQPATKIFLKTTEPEAAQWVSKAIGNVEIERMRETHFDGTRTGRNFTVDRQIEPLVMDSEISGLEERNAFLKLGNNVARFHFEYMDLPKVAPDFLPRKLADDEFPRLPKDEQAQENPATPLEAASESSAADSMEPGQVLVPYSE